MKFFHSIWGIVLIGLIANFMMVAVVVFKIYSNIDDHLSSLVQTNTSVEGAAEQRPYWIMRSNEIELLAYDLKEQKSKLSQQKAEIAEMRARSHAEMAELQRLRSDIESYRLELEKAKEDIKKSREELFSQLVSIKQEEVKNLKALSNAYGALTPQSVVSVFKEMDDNLAVKILSQMKPEVVASIFEAMAQSNEQPVPGKDGKTMNKRISELSDKLRLVHQEKTKNS